MSQQNIMVTPGQPKRFLKKGEGLKRFAAYKPPLPASTNKIQRRQTFVKFKHESRTKNLNSIYPDLPSDDSINLSTEIPKIPPPKIMHTPIRPNRTALGPLVNFSTNTPLMTPTLRESESCERQFTRKVAFIQPTNEKKISFEGFRRPATPSPHPSPVTLPPEGQSSNDDVSPTSSSPVDVITPPKRYNLRGARRNASSNSTSSAAMLAFDRQIQRIEATVNELKRKTESCTCGASATMADHITSARATRKTTRARANKESRPPADADNTTPKILSALADEVAQLRSKFDEINLGR